MFPSWNSLPELEQYHDALGRVGIWAPVVFGIIALLIGAAWGTYNHKVEQRITELKSEKEQIRNSEVDARVGDAHAAAIDAKRQIPETVGDLLPGNEENLVFPNLRPEFLPKLASAKFHLFLGSHVVCINEFPFVVVRQAKEPMVVLDKDGDRLLLSAKFFDKSGKPVCEIVKNRFHVNYNNIFRVERPSAEQLTIVDNDLNHILEVNYLNQHAVRVVGEFYVRDGLGLRMSDEKLCILANDKIKATIHQPTAFLSPDGFAIDVHWGDDGLPNVTINGMILP